MLAQTLVWAGPAGVVAVGAAPMVLWVSAAYFGVRSLSHAMRDIQQFARSEREAVEWQAAQDAHHFERQVRLTQTSRVALPMLRHIAEVDGDIDEDDRHECRVLEQTIRDEIRGRRLLNEALRDQVIAHRRRGAFVQVLDDGGLDDVDPALMEPILDRAAEAISKLHSDRIIIRTAPKDSDKSLTVVAITVDATAAALGHGRRRGRGRPLARAPAPGGPGPRLTPRWAALGRRWRVRPSLCRSFGRRSRCTPSDRRPKSYTAAWTRSRARSAAAVTGVESAAYRSARAGRCEAAQPSTRSRVEGHKHRKGPVSPDRPLCTPSRGTTRNVPPPAGPSSYPTRRVARAPPPWVGGVW